MRTIAIGDIHGHLTELNELLLHRVKFNPASDRLVFLGDYLDVGDYGPEVVYMVQTCLLLSPQSFAVPGNHDERYLRYRRHERKVKETPGYVNPMRFGPRDLHAYQRLSTQALDFLESLPPLVVFSVDGETWVAVHAGLEPGKAPLEQDNTKVIRIRYIDPATGQSKGLKEKFEQPEGTVYWTEVYDGNANVVFGHHVHSRERPVVLRGRFGQRCVGVDTVLGYGGRLSAYVIETGEVIQ